MPTDDAQHRVPTQTEPSPPVSRRTLMKTAAGAGVAVAVAATVGPTGPIRRSAVSLGTDPPPVLTEDGHRNGAVVVQVLNARTGELAVFTDGARARIRDADLAARIAGTATPSPVVVHLIDPNAGALAVFTAGARTQIHNQDLAHRIVRAARV